MENQFLPQFGCDFVTNNCLEDNCFHQNSHLKRSQLKWLLEKSDNYCNHWTNIQTIDLFGLNIDLNNLDSNQMKIVFTFIKKTLNEMRTDSMTRTPNNRNESNDYRNLRHNVTTFLTLLRRRLFEICIQCKPIVSQKESKNSFCISIIKQMKGLLLFVGRLSQIRPQLIHLAINSDEKTSIFNYYHCSLDIWWTAVEVMHILDQNHEINLNDLALIKDQICGQQLCSQSIRLVIFDLIVFSINRFDEMVSNNYQSLSLFNCLCVKEMYVLVRHMFNAINNSVINESFFELIFSTLGLLTSDLNNCYPINDFKTIAFGTHSLEEPSLHFIWFFTNIVQTLNYDISGQFTPLPSQSIPSLFLRRITLFLRQNESNCSEKLSAVIMFCLNAINFWKPNTDILLPFAEYFLKNLNKRYSKASVEELAFIPKTSIKWHQIVREICDHRNHTFIENSFYMFLSLMSQQLSSVFKDCETKSKLMNWQKFKGKVVVNLRSNRFNSFDETASFNLFSFYLVLMNTNHEIWTDFSDIMIETTIRLIDSNKSLHNSELVLKFMFAVIHSKPNSFSEEKISAFIVKTFNDLLEQSVQNSNQRKCLSNIILIYFNELKTLLKSSQFLSSGFDKLLDIKFSAISNLNSTPDHQLFVINFISDLLKAINQNIESKGLDSTFIAIINTCLKSILPFVKQEVTQRNDNQILSEIAYSFTNLLNNIPQTNEPKLSSLFNDFLNLSRKNRQFLCTYLCLVLRNSELITNLNKESDINPTLISIWCRLLVSPDVNQSSIDEMTFRLSHIIEDMGPALTTDNINSSEIFFNFIKNMTKNMINFEQNSRMIANQIANKYFEDMIIMSEEVIKNDFSLNSIKKIYALISGLMSIGSQLIYIPSTTNCLLPKMIDSIIMPNLSNDVKLKLIPILQKAFPAIIEGLFKLEFNENEYIERQIRRIISFYLPLYVKRANAYITLKNQLEERNFYTLWIKQLFATIVHNFFNKHESCPISALIPFIEEFCKFDLNEEQLIAVFSGALLKISFTDQKSRESLLSLIGAISRIFAKQKKERILFDNQVFTEFIETNLSNYSTFGRLFEVINSICKSSSHLFHDLIGQITRTIESIEKKRSVGTDYRLRNALREFVNQKL